MSWYKVNVRRIEDGSFETEAPDAGEAERIAERAMERGSAAIDWLEAVTEICETEDITAEVENEK